MEGIKRLLDPLRRKIFLLLGRGIVKALKTDEGTQLIQVVALDGETISDVERMEEYGFTSVPDTDSEAAIGFVDGNRDQGIILCINDRRYRPKNLASGEVTVYDKNGSKVHLKADGTIEIEAKANLTVTSAGTVTVTGAGGTVIDDSVGITLKTGDAAAWAPCTVPFCLWSGVAHGGLGAGINKLKGQ